MTSDKQKHLEFIQAIITRMGNNLFMLKGWTITLIVGLFTLMFKDAGIVCFVFAFFVILIFWALDGYFLSMERAYRDLYDEVRKSKKETDYNLNAEAYRTGNNSWINSMFSRTLRIFYGTLLTLILFGAIYVKIEKINITWKISGNNYQLENKHLDRYFINDFMYR